MSQDDSTPQVPRIAAVLATLVVLGGALGVLGFHLGRDSVEPADAEPRAVRAPERADAEPRAEPADAEPRAEPAPEQRSRRGRGEPPSGVATIRTYAEGLRAGRGQGYERGFVAGGTEALALDRFGFAPATFYIVQFATGDGGRGLRIDTADQLLPGRSYLICNTNDLCSR